MVMPPKSHPCILGAGESGEPSLRKIRKLFDDWHSTYSGLVWATCEGVLNGRYREDVPDVVQNTWMKIWCSLLIKGEDWIDDHKAYLRTTAKRAAWEWARNRNSRGGGQSHVSIVDFSTQILVPDAMIGTDYDLRFVYEELRDKTLWLLSDELSPQEVLIFDSIARGASLKETADIIGCKKSNMTYRRDKLKEKVLAIIRDLNSPDDPDGGGSPGLPRGQSRGSATSRSVFLTLRSALTPQLRKAAASISFSRAAGPGGKYMAAENMTLAREEQLRTWIKSSPEKVIVGELLSKILELPAFMEYQEDHGPSAPLAAWTPRDVSFNLNDVPIRQHLRRGDACRETGAKTGQAEGGRTGRADRDGPTKPGRISGPWPKKQPISKCEQQEGTGLGQFNLPMQPSQP